MGCKSDFGRQSELDTNYWRRVVGCSLRNTPLWRCHRPWPRPLGGPLAEQPCGAGWAGRDPLWWPDGSGAESGRGCHTPSLQWPRGLEKKKAKRLLVITVFFFLLQELGWTTPEQVIPEWPAPAYCWAPGQLTLWRYQKMLPPSGDLE